MPAMGSLPDRNHSRREDMTLRITDIKIKDTKIVGMKILPNGNVDVNVSVDVNVDVDVDYDPDYDYDEDEDYYCYDEDHDSGTEQGEGHSAQESSSLLDAFDWNQAEILYEDATVVTSVHQLKVDDIVGWKSLGINPRTGIFIPEVLSVAQIIRKLEPFSFSSSLFSSSSSCPPSASGTIVMVRLIPRNDQKEDPTALASGFGFGFDSRQREMGPEQQGVAEEAVAWDDILSLGWRVLEL